MIQDGPPRMTPMKRGINKYGEITDNGVYGAHRQISYEQLADIYANARHKRDAFGQCAIDLATASYAQNCSRLRMCSPRNLRYSVAWDGIPMLPPIMDEVEPAKNEPASTVTTARTDTIPEETPRHSPVRDILPCSSPSTPVPSSAPRSHAGDRPMPVESGPASGATPVSTSQPMGESSPLIYLGSSPVPVSHPALVGDCAPSPEAAGEVVPSTPRPTSNLAAVPSPKASPSHSTGEVVPSTPNQKSDPAAAPSSKASPSYPTGEELHSTPHQTSNPAAAPSPKASPTHLTSEVLPSTPHQMLSPTTASVPGPELAELSSVIPDAAPGMVSPAEQLNSPLGSAHSPAPRTPKLATTGQLGLVASIPASTPKLEPTSFFIPKDVSQINFGYASPCFNSPRPGSSTSPRRTQPWPTKSRRRVSEPLLRSSLKRRASHRLSGSPAKKLKSPPSVTNSPMSRVPNTPLNPVTPAISWAKMTGRLSDMFAYDSPSRPQQSSNDIHNVDMHQNPDIFGALSDSDTHRSGSEIASAAQSPLPDVQSSPLPGVTQSELLDSKSSPGGTTPQTSNALGRGPSSTPATEKLHPELCSSSPSVSFAKPLTPAGRRSPQKRRLATPEVHDESPERHRTSDFGNDSGRRKRLATGDGFLIAPPAKRNPLGAKSPNTPSPQKLKRKADGEKPHRESPCRLLAQPPAKKIRHLPEGLGSPQRNEGARDEGGEKRKVSGPNGERRSTRLRAQKPSAIPKPAMPTAAAAKPKPAARRGGLTSTVRSEPQTLSQQTALNTRRNKGKAKYPAQVLARHQEEQDRAGAAQAGQAEAAVLPAGVKSVSWKTPLEAGQGTRAKRAGNGNKAAGGALKPPTPTRPRRITRSSARQQV